MLRRLSLLLVIPLLAAVSLRAGEDKFSPTKEEKKLLELVNAERKKEDKAPLKLSPLLTKLARAHSANMAKQRKLEHTLDDKTAFDRLRDAGYEFRKAGENIAYGEGKFDLAEIWKGWMESEGHRNNILSGDYTEIGLGVGKNGKGEVYYTQVFAKPRK